MNGKYLILPLLLTVIFQHFAVAQEGRDLVEFRYGWKPSHRYIYRFTQEELHGKKLEEHFELIIEVVSHDDSSFTLAFRAPRQSVHVLFLRVDDSGKPDDNSFKIGGEFVSPERRELDSPSLIASESIFGLCNEMLWLFPSPGMQSGSTIFFNGCQLFFRGFSNSTVPDGLK